ncbi:VOC family protein [Nonomuraea sp. NPDC050691]|uniref:VOC family protein n=1 Tax=Nonomuraea sp. NPDC050691 TaxID=3155661 RepID=UPI0033C04786
MTPDSKLTRARWTHVALPSCDLDKAITFYTTMTPLVVVARHADENGRNAWLSNDGQVETPFVLVLVEFAKDRGKPQPQLGPFAHLGMEVPERADVDRMAAEARSMACLHWEPMDLPDPVGYVCALKDPDGNVVEISHGQKVYEEVRTLWHDR